MSADENILISVEDAEIDATIAKLEEALDKQAQLTGQAPAEAEQPYIIPVSEMESLEKPYMNAPDFSAFYRGLDQRTAEAKANVDDTVAESEIKLENLKREASDAVNEAEGEVANVGTQIRGLESTSRRVIRMIPGLREAQRLTRSMELLSAGNLMGVAGLLMVSWSIYRQMSSMMDAQKQQDTDYRRMIMEARGFKQVSQYKSWQEDQNRLDRGYMTTTIP